MSETQRIEPAGIEPRPIDYLDRVEGNARERARKLVHHPYFQRFCEDRRKPMTVNDSLHHGITVFEGVARGGGTFTGLVTEFVSWCREKGYELE